MYFFTHFHISVKEVMVIAMVVSKIIHIKIIRKKNYNNLMGTLMDIQMTKQLIT